MPIDANGNLIPDFGDAPAAGASPSGSPGTPGLAYDGPRKMAFICSKGNLDMAYPALIMANAALGEGVEVHIFFTFWGLDIVDVRTQDTLKFTFAGNTAMHMPQLERAAGGWGTKSFPQAMAALPGVTPFATHMMKQQMADLGIPPVKEMVETVAALGGNLWACRLTVDMMQIKKAQLDPAVKDIISAADFIELSAGAQIVFV
ncbi:MAG: DsrE/DsrF/DrsH-like family protein [Ruaniaceae bacterium]|nr:DsrE/DsrF/DrsH-like family protein [Ruaniaceae bacterium]